MKRLTPLMFILAVALLLSPVTAMAGEALPALKGKWVAESFNGEKPEEGVSITMEFVDDSKMKMSFSFGGKSETKEFRYSATKDGKITVYDDEEDNPEGEKATWEIKNKKLHITSVEEDEKQEMVFARAS